MAVRKTKAGLALKRWFKEDWKDHGTGGKKKKAKKKAMGGVVQMANGGNVSKGKVKRPSKNPNIARGCGVVMSNRRKITKFR